MIPESRMEGGNFVKEGREESHKVCVLMTGYRCEHRRLSLTGGLLRNPCRGRLRTAGPREPGAEYVTHRPQTLIHWWLLLGYYFPSTFVLLSAWVQINLSGTRSHVLGEAIHVYGNFSLKLQVSSRECWGQMGHQLHLLQTWKSHPSFSGVMLTGL